MKKEITKDPTQNEEQAVTIVPERKRPFAVEFLISAAIALLIGAFAVLLYQLQIVNTKEFKPVSLTYSEGKTIVFSGSFALMAFVCSLFVTVLTFASMALIKPSGIKPVLGKNCKNLIFMNVLGLFGILALLVISIFLTTLEVSNAMSLFIASVLVPIYDIFIYKLYMEERTFSNHLFWEIFRFAIVGLVAAVFDFLLCFIFQFLIFKGSNSWYVSGISTAMGFALGVVINYILSTYMVYKNAKTNTSKTAKGIILFLVLAIIGLLLGIGIQYFLYDFLNLKKGVALFSYPICFVVRTLIVMVYNYISRKIFIYK